MMRSFKLGFSQTSLRASLALLLILGTSSAAAEPFQLSLLSAAGETTPVAEMNLKPDGHYSVDWDAQLFSDHFLSMRPFKCLSTGENLWCRVPYPYPIERNLSQDSVDLEYDLLFVWKRAGEYGINLRNGLYFRLSPDGAGYRGQLHHVDLEALGVPPEDGEMRPIKAEDLERAEPAGFAWPEILIQPQ